MSLPAAGTSSRPSSQWSAVNIGLQVESKDKESMNRQFREEAHRVTKYLEGVHHSQKLSYAQKDYGETVSKLSKIGQEPQVYIRRPPPAQTHSSSHNMVVARKNEITDAMNQSAYSEHDLNSRKRNYNRQVGRIAIVDSVSEISAYIYVCCSTPMSKDKRL
jgi:hypothetical protein